MKSFIPGRGTSFPFLYSFPKLRMTCKCGSGKHNIRVEIKNSYVHTLMPKAVSTTQRYSLSEASSARANTNITKN